MGNRVNQRRVPRTQKDVDAAYDRGVTEGLHRGIELMLYVLIDKRSAPMDDVQRDGRMWSAGADGDSLGKARGMDTKRHVKQCTGAGLGEVEWFDR